MNCVIFSRKGEHLFTNTCFLTLQKEFVNMTTLDVYLEDNFTSVIMNDHSEDEIKDYFNGFVVTEHQLSLISEPFESGKESRDFEPEPLELTREGSIQAKPGETISLSQDLEPLRKRSIQAKPGGKKSFLCQYCGKEFVNSTKLKVHKFDVHSNNKDYNCSICGKVLKTKTTLYHHKFIHSEPRFSCIRCSRVWIVKSHIKSKCINKGANLSLSTASLFCFKSKTNNFNLFLISLNARLFAFQTFTYKHHLDRHLKTCKI